METVRVLVANEPRSYREAVAGVLRAVCGPFLEVSVAEPEGLDAAVVGARSHLVVCSLATPAVRDTAGVWVELYPGHGSLSNVGFHGKCRRWMAWSCPTSDQSWTGRGRRWAGPRGYRPLSQHPFHALGWIGE